MSADIAKKEFTLLAFHTHKTECEADLGDNEWLKKLLAEIEPHAIKLDWGIYVFKTVKHAELINLAERALKASTIRHFCLVPFDAPLQGGNLNRDDIRHELEAWGL
jgi:hypothetical protein